MDALTRRGGDGGMLEEEEIQDEFFQGCEEGALGFEGEGLEVGWGLSGRGWVGWWWWWWLSEG